MHSLPSRTLISIASAPPAVAPEPVVALADDTSDDMRHLTQQINSVLTGRVPATRTSPTFIAANTSLPFCGELDPPATVNFDRPPSAATSNQAAGWVMRAKRERRFERVRSAASWAISLGFAVVIAGAAAVVVQQGVFDTSKFSNAVSALGF